MSQKSHEMCNRAVLLATAKKRVHIAMKEIPLTQGKVALVDDEDFEGLIHYKWYPIKTLSNCYAARNIPKSKGKIIYMHRAILNPPSNMQIDHINGNGLDNRKENLRVVTNRENQQNLRDSPIRKYTSKYPGVSKLSSGKFRALIQIKKVNKYLGQFENELDAANAYQKECLSLNEGKN